MNIKAISTVITVVVLVIIAGLVLPTFLDGVGEMGSDMSNDGDKTSSLLADSISSLVLVFFFIVLLFVVVWVVKSI